MAKGKVKESKAKPASKKRDNTLLYGIGVLILIVVIVLVMRSGKEAAGPADVDATSGQQTQTDNQVKEDTTLKGVTEELACSAGAAIGFKACNLLANGDVEVVVFHSISSVVEPLTLTGAQYYLYDENGEKLAEASQMGTVQPGQEAKYTLPLNGNPSAMKVEVRPVVNVDGVDKICVNQRVIVIPANSCK
ncbi:hypothetical protein COV19_03045 [Candidatus Woesearchaeota archaeon CG10_big_fil_rev_8_21_14_0_10_44_13]|nr:MAG: hypothetical protein COV19_03045 [Candidatus Woesearchaeota archaeon CG10_big_fil_rev_8_21_14_0_10_44_13]